jgi:beta-galactosidase
MRAAMSGDLMRSLGRGRPWVLMEQSPNRVNWREINAAKAPGQMRLWSYQAIARGADGVMFFQWRQSRAGAEKWHSAAVPHGPAETSPAWHEVVGLGQELGRLDVVCGSRGHADVAILLDWESWWALELPSKPTGRLRQIEQVEACYRPLFEANITTDFARPVDDLSGYKLVIAPSLYMVSDEAAANLVGYVNAGGTLVMSFFSGMVDSNDHIRLGGYPKPFTQLLGLNVVDFMPLGNGEEVPVQLADGTQATGRIWSELIEPAGAEVLAHFSGSALAGRPAVTRNRFGAGTAFYYGTLLDPLAMAGWLRSTWTDAGAKPVAETPSGTEAVRRTAPGGSLLFLLNHEEVAADVSVTDAGVNLIDGRPVQPGRLTIGPRNVAVIFQERMEEGRR